MNKSCIACGMPMTEVEHYSMKDTSRDYCCHCTKEDGSMRSYDETLAGMTKLMVNSQGMTESAAKTAVKEMMANLPAWKDVTTK